MIRERGRKIKALITGITGQDGSYLAELLLEKGYEVHGIVRGAAFEDIDPRMWRIRNICDKLVLHSVSLENYASVFKVVEKVVPDECYHLAAQIYVGYSFDEAFSTINVNLNSTHYVLSSLKEKAPKCKFYFAGSSEMFGLAKESPQNENTPFHPRSSYGISKVAGFDLTRNYREAFNMYAVSGILFNHESPLRGLEYVTRKITNAAVRIKLGLQNELSLGDIEAKRDWGFAGDYVEAMWRMLQQNEPDDYVIATGETHSVREFIEMAFGLLDLDYKKHIVIDDKLMRPSEVNLLCGDFSKAKKTLGWEPKVRFRELVKMMVDYDLNLIKNNMII